MLHCESPLGPITMPTGFGEAHSHPTNSAKMKQEGDMISAHPAVDQLELIR